MFCQLSLSLLPENESDILMKSFKALDWLYKLSLAFNYLLINSIIYVNTFCLHLV
jgi:hypothetical protein